MYMRGWLFYFINADLLLELRFLKIIPFQVTLCVILFSSFYYLHRYYDCSQSNRVTTSDYRTYISGTFLLILLQIIDCFCCSTKKQIEINTDVSTTTVASNVKPRVDGVSAGEVGIPTGDVAVEMEAEEEDTREGYRKLARLLDVILFLAFLTVEIVLVNIYM